MDTNQKLKLLQLFLHYVTHKLRNIETEEKPCADFRCLLFNLLLERCCSKEETDRRSTLA
jgi:hypothetical protein